MALLDDLRGKLKDYWKDKYDSRTGDGTTTIWKLSKAPLTSQTITVNGTAYTDANQYNIDKDTGIVKFTTVSGAPGDNTAWTATYQYAMFSDDQLYTFLNNAIRVMEPDIYLDAVTDVTGDNLVHFDKCEATASWLTGAGATNPVLNSQYTKEGKYSLSLGCATTSGMTGTYTNNAASALDGSNKSYLNLWILSKYPTYLDDREAISVRLGSVSSAYMTYTWSRDCLKTNDWSHLSVAFSDMSSVGTVVMSALDYAQITIKLSNAMNSAITSGDLVMDDWRMSTFPIASYNQVEYTLPAKWFSVNQIEEWDDENTFVQKVIAFDNYEGKVRVGEDVSDGNYLKLFGSKNFNTLHSSGSYTTDMPSIYNEMVVNHAAAEAIESQLVERSRYNAYSTTITPQGASLGSLQNAAQLYRNLWRESMARYGGAIHASELGV